MDTLSVTPVASTTALSTLPAGKLHPRSAQAAARLLEMMREREFSENLQRLMMVVGLLQSVLHYTTNGDIIMLALWDAETRLSEFLDPDIMAQMKEWFITEAAVARSTNRMAY
jgi:hypothetical protein